MNDTESAKARAELIKQALMKYILEVANTKEKKEKLSQFLGKALPSIDSLVYEGEGKLFVLGECSSFSL